MPWERVVARCRGNQPHLCSGACGHTPGVPKESLGPAPLITDAQRGTLCLLQTAVGGQGGASTASQHRLCVSASGAITDCFFSYNTYTVFSPFTKNRLYSLCKFGKPRHTYRRSVAAALPAGGPAVRRLRLDGSVLC